MIVQVLLVWLALVDLTFSASFLRGKNTYDDSDDDKIPTTSIIDVLSANASFSYLLHTLQRSDLIDYINELANITFLAPVNDAFIKNHIPRGHVLSKDELNRFIINTPVFKADVIGINIFETMNNNGSPFLQDFHIPILLDHSSPGEYLVENSHVLEEEIYIDTIDSVLLTIDDLLIDKKLSTCEYFADTLNRDTGTEHFKTFSDLLLSENSCHAFQLSNTTFLVPSDESLTLNNVEKKYLKNTRGLTDKHKFLSNFLINGIIGGHLGNGTVLRRTDLNKHPITISSSYLGNELLINNEIHSTTANYLLSDSIIHYFDTQLFDYDDISRFPTFTPRKYLIGLEYEDFVDEVDFRSLSALIDDKSLNQTIFVSKDFESFSSLKNQMLYHFVENQFDPSIPSQLLLNSKYCNSLFCHRIKVDINDSKDIIINEHSQVMNSVPYRVGNTSIFLIDEELFVPPKLQTAISSELVGFTKSISFFKQFNFLKKLSNGHQPYTVFFPSTGLWNSLDITLDYLIGNPTYLKKTLEHLVIKGLIYDDFVGIEEFDTLDDCPIEISRQALDSPLVINDTYSLDISFDDEILFSNGVLHPIDDELPLPASLEVSTFDLLKSQDSLEFLKILETLNLTDIAFHSNFSFLLPTSKSLLQENITALLTDYKYLENFVKLHILPPGSIDMIFACYDDEPNSNSNLTTQIPTLKDGVHLTCRELASGSMMLSITEGSANEVRILRSGKSIDGSDTTQGIFLLDRPLNPQWMNENSPNKLYLHLPLIAIMVGILIGIILVLLTCGCCLVLTLGNSKRPNKPSDDAFDNQDNLSSASSGNADPRIEHVVTVNETLPLLNDDNFHANESTIAIKSNRSNNTRENGMNISFDNGEYGSLRLSNSYDIKSTEGGKKWRDNYNNGIGHRNSLGHSLETRKFSRDFGQDDKRTLRKYQSEYNTFNRDTNGRRFDSKYSINACALPIDMNVNN